MKTIKIKAYTAKELRKKNPEGFERAHEEYNNSVAEYIPWADEISESLKGLFKHTNGISLRDWEIGAYSYSYIKVEFSQDEAGELTGPRAMAWLENNLLADLRIPFCKMFENVGGWNPTPNRGVLSQYGKFYRPGMIHPCPFTGYCFDETLLESLQKDIQNGNTLKESFENLADVTRKELETEMESQQSEEYFLDTADANEWLFTLDGKML